MASHRTCSQTSTAADSNAMQDVTIDPGDFSGTAELLAEIPNISKELIADSEVPVVKFMPVNTGPSKKENTRRSGKPTGAGKKTLAAKATKRTIETVVDDENVEESEVKR